MKPILIIMLSRGVGGLEQRTATVYKHLCQHSCDCHITFLVNRSQFTLLDGYRIVSSNLNCRLVVFGLPYNSILKGQSLYYLLDYFFLFHQLLLWFPLKKYHLAYFTKFASLPFRHLVRANKKVLAFVDSHTPQRVLSSRNYIKIMKENFHIDCLSKDLRKKALAHPAGRHGNIHVSPCSFIDYSNTSIAEKNNAISFVGRFADGKGISLLLPVIPEIINKYPDAHFNLLGYGPLQNQITRFLTDNKIKQVTVSFAPQPVLLLKHSLIFLSLQEKENYPSQSLLEAMACGNAIIATDVGLTRELVNSDVGVCIERNSEALFTAIDKMLTDFEKTSSMGLKARNTVLKKHTTENYLQYFTQTFVSTSTYNQL